MKTAPPSLALAATVAAILLSPGAGAAPDSAAKAKEPPVRLEKLEGGLKRVILTAKAAERLGIEVGKIDTKAIEHKQMFGGLVVPAPGAQVAPPQPQGGGLFRMSSPPDAPAGNGPKAASPGAAPGALWVQVSLSRPELERIAGDRPARLLALSTREAAGAGIPAKPTGMPPREDAKRAMLHLYYQIDGSGHGLQVNRRVRVEVPLAEAAETHTVMPYSALYYDARGGTWCYVNTAPLTYERKRVAVKRIAGDLALLESGPPVGTPIVTVGAALLYGAEIFGK